MASEPGTALATKAAVGGNRHHAVRTTDGGLATRPSAAAVHTCLYRNSRDRMVILRCIGPQSYFLEKVIFPFETWTFEAPRQAEVELWCHGLGGAELLERLNSDQLQLLDAPIRA